METNVLSERLAIFRINYKSDFILTLESDAGWMTPFCIKFWTSAPSQAYFASYDGETYTHCAPVEGEPTKLQVQFDNHHLPIGELKYQVAYHFTVDDFPNDTEDEVINQDAVIIDNNGRDEKVLLDFNGETAPDIAFSLPAYANEAQRISNEQQRIAAETQRIANEETRIANEQTRINQEQTRQQNEQQRINQEQARVNEYASLKADAVAATVAANDAAALANQKAQLAADKAALAQSAANLANAKAQLAADKAALAASAAQLANDKAALAQQKAEYAQTQGDYAKAQGDYAKEQGDTALADHQRAEADHGIAVDDHTQAGNDHTRAESDHGIAVDDHTQAGNDHTRAESDHGIAVDDHTQAGNDHTRAESDHGIAVDDHTQAGNDHTRAESDHTRAESDHDAVELYVDSLGVFDLSKHNAVGGVLATYADLDAALAALNALDSQYKYGGMSFKFVQSSDNKYMQYRFLLSGSFTDDQFTDETNWNNEDVDKDARFNIDTLTQLQDKVILDNELYQQSTLHITRVQENRCLYISALGAVTRISREGCFLARIDDLASHVGEIIKIEIENSIIDNSDNRHYVIYSFYDSSENYISPMSEPVVMSKASKCSDYVKIPNGAVSLHISTTSGSLIDGVLDNLSVLLLVNKVTKEIEERTNADTQISNEILHLESYSDFLNKKIDALAKYDEIPPTIKNLNRYVRMGSSGGLGWQTANETYHVNVVRVDVSMYVGKSVIISIQNTAVDLNQNYIPWVFADNYNSGFSEIHAVPKNFTQEANINDVVTIPDNKYLLITVQGGTELDTNATNVSIKVAKDSIEEESALNVENDVVHSYLNDVEYDDSDYSYTCITDYNHISTRYRKDQPKGVLVTWVNSGNATALTAKITDNNGHTKEISLSVNDTYAYFYNFAPNTPYCIKIVETVSGGTTNVILSKRIKCIGQLRMAKLDSIANVRDLGGWKTIDNKSVKYGVIFRGSRMDDKTSGAIISNDDKDTMLNLLGVGVDVDFRNASDLGDISSSVLGVTWVNIKSIAFISTGIEQASYLSNIISTILPYLRQKKTIYMHCAGGADRTGGTAFCILGLLGVSESDLMKDYELTSFSNGNVGVRCRNSTTTWDIPLAVSQIKAMNGDTLRDKFDSFAISGGSTQAELDELRALMLQ
jgi:hypothetical protein